MNSLSKIISLTLLSVIMTGCVADRGDAPCADDEGDGNVTVRLTLRMGAPEAGATTRAAGIGHVENRITDAAVLLFTPAARSTCNAFATTPDRFYRLVTVKDEDITRPATADGDAVAYDVEFTVKLGVDAEAPDYLLPVLVANAGSLTLPEDAAGKSYDEIRQYCNRTLTPAAPGTDTPDKMTFWGIARTGNGIAGLIDRKAKVSEVKMDLLRDMARVNVSLADEVTNFRITDICVSKVSSGAAMVPDLSVVTRDDDYLPVLVPRMKSPSLPSDVSVSDAGWGGETSDGTVSTMAEWHWGEGVVSTDGRSITDRVYIPESEVRFGKEDADPGDENRLNRAAVLIGGRYGSSQSTTWYRVDFARRVRPASAEGNEEPEPVSELMDVLRNHSYNIVITSVLGPGEDTPQKAYETIQANIRADIIDWTNIDTFIVFDGVHWLSVATKELMIAGAEGSGADIHVASDIPADEWRLQWETIPAAGGEAQVLTEFTERVSAGCDIFRVTRPEGNVSDGGELSFKALQALPEGHEPRARRLRLRVSTRLEVEINVTQGPLADDEWENGGYVHDILQ